MDLRINEEEFKMSKVVVYSSNTCPYCVSAKNYLNENGVDFEEKNIQTNAEARQELMQMGHMGVPVILVDDEEIVGFDKNRIDNALGL